jgi:hypothetical protein
MPDPRAKTPVVMRKTKDIRCFGRGNSYARYSFSPPLQVGKWLRNAADGSENLYNIPSWQLFNIESNLVIL